MKINLYGIVDDSIVDGPGLRFSIFTQGCPHHCPGCHNPESQSFEGGQIWDIHDLLKKIDANPLLDGVTLTGGEPFVQSDALIELAKAIRLRHLHLMVYSGYTYEEIMHLGDSQRELLSLCDTLVDGRFVLNLRSLSLLYKGSSNQRIIDIQKSLEINSVIEQKNNEFGEFVY